MAAWSGLLVYNLDNICVSFFALGRRGNKKVFLGLPIGHLLHISYWAPLSYFLSYMHDFCFYLSENTFWKYGFDWVLLTKSSSTGPEMCLLKYFIFKHQFLLREQNGPLWRVCISITVRWSRNQSGLRTHEAWSQFFLNKQKFCFSQVVGLMWGFQICKFKNRALRT